MKKLISVILAVIILSLLCSISFSSVAFAETNEDATSYISYNYMQKFEIDFPSRFMGTDEELDASKYIASEFERLGYIGAGNNNTYFEKVTFNMVDETDYSSQIRHSNNVIATNDSNSQKTVIIGTCYDNNIQSYKKGGATDAYSSGSGIAGLLTLATILKDVDLPYKLYFVAYGASYSTGNGVRTFYESLTDAEKNNIIAYINFDSISGGDDIYIYCEEKSSIQEDFFFDKATDKLNLKKAPKDKKEFNATTDFNYLPYLHVGIGYQGIFRKDQIVAINFLSNDWDGKTVGVYESANHANLQGTANDNLEILEDYYGVSFYERIDELCLSVANALTSSEFVSVMEQSKSKLKDYSFYQSRLLDIISYSVIGIIVIVFIVLLVYFKKHDSYIERNGGDNGNGNSGNAFDEIVEKNDEKKKVFEEF